MAFAGVYVQYVKRQYQAVLAVNSAPTIFRIHRQGQCHIRTCFPLWIKTWR